MSFSFKSIQAGQSTSVASHPSQPRPQAGHSKQVKLANYGFAIIVKLKWLFVAGLRTRLAEEAEEEVK